MKGFNCSLNVGFVKTGKKKNKISLFGMFKKIFQKEIEGLF